MRSLLIAIPLLLGTLAPIQAAVSVGIGINVPGVSIGIHVPVYPHLVRVPGYPVYYDPQASANYFFYDGLYWVYRDDTWYQSVWYDGPWQSAGPDLVPLYVLRVPVRYYRQPPIYFRGWASTRPPHWGEHWGRDWEVRRAGWDRWDHRERPTVAPLPVYQRAYSGDRYPHRTEEQHTIRSEKYTYQPREPVAKQTFEQRGRPDAATPGGPAKPVAQAGPQAEMPMKGAPDEARQKGEEAKTARQENRSAEQQKRGDEKELANEKRQEAKAERGKDKPQQ